jgi:hypothetical protein
MLYESAEALPLVYGVDNLAMLLRILTKRSRHPDYESIKSNP